jgi:hypothetical protein
MFWTLAHVCISANLGPGSVQQCPVAWWTKGRMTDFRCTGTGRLAPAVRVQSRVCKPRNQVRPATSRSRSFRLLWAVAQQTTHTHTVRCSPPLLQMRRSSSTCRPGTLYLRFLGDAMAHHHAWNGMEGNSKKARDRDSREGNYSRCPCEADRTETGANASTGGAAFVWRGVGPSVHSRLGVLRSPTPYTCVSIPHNTTS